MAPAILDVVLLLCWEIDMRDVEMEMEIGVDAGWFFGGMMDGRLLGYSWHAIGRAAHVLGNRVWAAHLSNGRYLGYLPPTTDGRGGMHVPDVGVVTVGMGWAGRCTRAALAWRVRGLVCLASENQTRLGGRWIDGRGGGHSNVFGPPRGNHSLP